MKILMGGGLLSPSVGHAATRLDPPMNTIHAHHGLVWISFRLGITFIRKVVIPRNTRHQTKRIRRRSNARANSPVLSTRRNPVDKIVLKLSG